MKAAKAGDLISFRVDRDVVVNHQVVILKDVTANGRFSNSDNDAPVGKGGKLGVTLDSTSMADGQRIRLRLSKDKSNDDKGMAGMALDKIFKVFGFLKIGGDQKIKSGTKIKGYTAEEKRVRIRNSAS